MTSESNGENTHRDSSDAGIPRRPVGQQDTGIRPSPDPEVVEQDPGERQKRNQGREKEDPLAA